MSDQSEAWEKWYNSNPTNWKGSPLPLPHLEKGARILDVGCGTGNTMLQALSLGYEVVGIDLSRSAVQRAEKRILDRGYHAFLIHGNILDDKLELGKFDCILLHHVLDNMLVEERKLLIGRVKDLLQDGGMVSFQDVSLNDVRYGNGKEVERNTFIKGDGIMLHFFDIDETRELFGGMKELELGEHEWFQGQGDRKIRKSRIIGLFQLPSFSTRGSTSGA